MKLSPIALTPFVVAVLSCTGSDSASQPTSETSPAAGSSAASVSAAAASVAQRADNPSSSESKAATSSSLHLPPLAPGFQRLMAAAVDVPAGTTDDWIQWVGGPTDQDYDVVALTGAQSVGGHHALLLSISEGNSVGFTRKYTERDQLTSSSLGGIGAEGAVAIPEGVVFRIRKGTYLAVQAHYLNPTDKDIHGESYIDVKLVPKDPANTVAGHFASTTTSLLLPPHAKTELDVNCTVAEDLQVLRMTNHMHYTGASVSTQVTDPSGKTRMLKQDDSWNEEWALRPNYDNFAIASPLLLAAGSKLHTHCVWNNTTDKALTFPEEMCVFATVILGEKEISCVDGKFAARSASGPSQSAPAAGVASMSGAGSAGSSASAPASAGAPSAAAGSGACTDSADAAILGAPEFQDKQRTCGSMCFGAADSCATACLTKNTMLTPGCAACNGSQITCAMMHCIGDCAGGFMSATCGPCMDMYCGAEYHTCAGL
jgi:hypothetical protein